MPYQLPAIKSLIDRQFTAGNIVLIIMAIWMLGPYVIDRARGEPAIQVKLTLQQEESEYFIKEDIRVKYPNRGVRTNVAVDSDDRILCANNYESYWDRSRFRVWSFRAFTGCNVPLVPFRVCSVFSVRSKSGIERKLGGDGEICSQAVVPKGE